jgi:dUTP pyrophosphatase
MTLLVKLLTLTAVLPTRAHADDAGLDLYADESVWIGPGERAWVKTGIAVAIAPAYVGLVWPRSGLAGKGLTVDAGVIDCGYRGEVKVLMCNTNNPNNQWKSGWMEIAAGDKIAQLLIQVVASPGVESVNELPPSGRGDNGFGSSG